MKSFLHGPAVGVQSCAGQARKTQGAPRIPKVLPQKVPKPPLPCLWCPCGVWPLFLAFHCTVPLPKRGSSAHAEPELRPLRALSVTQPRDLQERLCLGVSRCFSSCFAGVEPPQPRCQRCSLEGTRVCSCERTLSPVTSCAERGEEISCSFREQSISPAESLTSFPFPGGSRGELEAERCSLPAGKG